MHVNEKEIYADQEIFKLVRFYNNSYLPSKLRWIDKEKKDDDSGLSMDDLTNFNA